MSAGFLLWMFSISLGFDMISKPNTVENIIGFFIVIIVTLLMFNTKFLTIIRLKKHEKTS